MDLLTEVDILADELYESSEVLEDYGAAIRYPGDWFEPTLQDVEDAYNSAKKIKDFVNIRISNLEFIK